MFKLKAIFKDGTSQILEDLSYLDVIRISTEFLHEPFLSSNCKRDNYILSVFCLDKFDKIIFTLSL